MSVEETRRVVEGYLAGLDPHWLAEAIELVDMRSRETFTGRDQVGSWLGRLASQMLSTPRLGAVTLTAGERRAAVEWELRGRRVTWVDGEEPSGTDMAVPMAAVYEVEAGQIVSVRLYYDAPDFIREAAIEMTPPP